jgi:hypothetical protein
MQCRDAREHLLELDGDRLPAGVEREVHAHLAECQDCRQLAEADRRLRALLLAHVAQDPAPPALRRRVTAVLRAAEGARPAWRARVGWRGWLVPALAGVAAIGLVSWGAQRWLARDPTTTLLAHAVVEHAEYVQETMPRQAPDPRRLVAALEEQAGFRLAPVFLGDGEVTLVATSTAALEGHRAAALIYRNAAGIYSSLFLLPEDVPIPAEGRMAIQTYKPHRRVTEGRQVLLWKQHGLTHLLVSDLGEGELPSMFLRIRTAA